MTLNTSSLRRPLALLFGLCALTSWTGGCSPGGGTPNHNGTLDDNANQDKGSPGNNDNGDGDTGANNNGQGNGNTNNNSSNDNQNTNDNENDNNNENGSDDCLTLEVELISSAAGSVTLDPDRTCYAAGAVVEIRAQANSTFTFVSFSGAVNSSDPVVTVTMNRDKSVGASFAGNLFVLNFRNTNSEVLEFNPLTGQQIREFIGGASGLNAPVKPAFGPQGNLFVSTQIGSETDIREYDGTTGALLGTLISDVPTLGGMTFGANGNLFITALERIEEYNSSDGSFVRTVVDADSGLVNAGLIQAGPDGDLFVIDTGTPQSRIRRFDSSSGEQIGQAIEGSGIALDFTVASDGNILLPDTVNGQVTLFNPQTATPVLCPCLCLSQCPGGGLPSVDYVISDLMFPSGLDLGPSGDLFIVANQTVRVFDISGPPADRGDFVDGATLSNIGYVVFKPTP